MIVKIQKPLGGNLDNLLIYNEAKTLYMQWPIAVPGGGVLMQMLGDRPKMYCKAEVDEKGILDIGDEVVEPDW